MRLPDLISDYIAYRRALGGRMRDEAFMLRAFCKSVAGCSPSVLTADQLRTYLHHGCVSPRPSQKGIEPWADSVDIFPPDTVYTCRPCLGLQSRTRPRSFLTSIPTMSSRGCFEPRRKPVSELRRSSTRTRYIRCCCFCMAQDCAWGRRSDSMSAMSICVRRSSSFGKLSSIR